MLKETSESCNHIWTLPFYMLRNYNIVKIICKCYFFACRIVYLLRTKNNQCTITFLKK